PLVAAEGGLAVELEDLAELQPRILLDLAVELDEGNAELCGEPAPQGRLAGAAQADEGDAVAPPRRHRRAERAAEEPPRLGELLRRDALQGLDEEGELARPVRPLAHELRQRQAHRLRHLAQQDDRDVALAALELRQIALRDAGIARQDLPRHAAPRPRLADALAQEPQIL